MTFVNILLKLLLMHISSSSSSNIPIPDWGRNIQADEHTSIINLGENHGFLPNFVQCCSQKFHGIRVDGAESRNLEEFLQIIGNTSQVKLWISLKFNITAEEVAGFPDLVETLMQLDKRGQIDKLVVTLPVIFCDPLPAYEIDDGHDDDEDIIQVKFDYISNLAFNLQKLHEQSNISLGLEPVDYSGDGRCYNSKLHDGYRLLLANLDFSIVKVELGRIIYVYSEFRTFIDEESMDTIKRIRVLRPNFQVVLNVKLFTDKRMSNDSRRKSYEMMANFAFRYGKEKKIRVQCSFYYHGLDSEVNDLQKLVVLNDWVVGGNLSFLQIAKCLIAVASEFSTVLIDPPMSSMYTWNLQVFHEFLEIVHDYNEVQGQANGTSLSIIVRLKCFKERGLDVANFLERLKFSNEHFPHLVSGIVVELLSCTRDLSPTVQRVYGGKKWMHMPRWSSRVLAAAQEEANFIRERAEAFNISVLAVDVDGVMLAEIIALPNNTNTTFDIFPNLLVPDYRNDFDSVHGTRDWLNNLEIVMYNHGKHNIWAEFLWDSKKGRDCSTFNEIAELILQWSWVHDVTLVVNSAFDNSQFKKGWYTTVGLSTSSAEASRIVIGSKLDDPCVSVSSEPVFERIEFNSTLTYISLLYQVNGSEISSNKLGILLDFVTLRFTNLEIRVADFHEANKIFRQIGDIYKLGPPLQIYVNIVISNDTKLGSEEMEIATFKRRVEKLKFCKVVALNFESEKEGNERAENYLKFLLPLARRRFESRNNFLPLGFSVKMHSALSNYESSLHKMQFANFILVEVDLVQLGYSEYDLSSMFGRTTTSPRQLRRFHGIFTGIRQFRDGIETIAPNMEVKLRFRWPIWSSSVDFTCISQTRSEVENMLRFWRFVNEFCSTFNFTYIIDSAMEFSMVTIDNDVCDHETEGKKFSWAAGWWRYSNISDFESFVEKESEYLGLATPKPAPKLIFSNKTDGNIRSNKDDILLIVVGGSLVLVFLVVVIIALAVHLHRRNVILSRDEVRVFIEGLKDDASGLTGESRILGLAYKSNLEICKEEFRVSKSSIIGTGHFGIVYKADIPRFDDPVAVKVPQSGKSISDMEATIKSFLSEIKIMSCLSEHENVVKILGAYTKEIKKGVAYVVTEYCEKGSLQSYLHSISTSLDPEQRNNHQVDIYELVRFAQEIAAGMEYIANKHIIHGDLSTRNVLLNNSTICKICDFGLSRKLDTYGKYVKGEKEVLPWRWMAFESLKKMEFTVKSDVWSYGVTLWEIFTLADVPFPERVWNEEFLQALENGVRLRCPKYSNDDMYKILCQCWELDAEKRPTFSELIPLFQQFRRVEYAKVVA